jgi:hypothetical protein
MAGAVNPPQAMMTNYHAPARLSQDISIIFVKLMVRGGKNCEQHQSSY